MILQLINSKSCANSLDLLNLFRGQNLQAKLLTTSNDQAYLPLSSTNPLRLCSLIQLDAFSNNHNNVQKLSISNIILFYSIYKNKACLIP